MRWLGLFKTDVNGVLPELLALVLPRRPVFQPKRTDYKYDYSHFHLYITKNKRQLASSVQAIYLHTPTGVSALLVNVAFIE